MPFKTRRQKLAAAQRRYTFIQSNPISYRNDTQPNLSEKTDVNKTKTDRERIEIDYGYVKKDLLKILLFAGAICLIQISLMFILRT